MRATLRSLRSVIASEIHCHSFICPARQLFIRFFLSSPYCSPALISQINFNLTQFQRSYFTMPFGLIQNALMLVRSHICLLVCSLALSLISFTSPLNIFIVTILMTKHFARSEQLKQLNRQAYSHARTHTQTHVYTFMMFYFHIVAREHTTTAAAVAAAERNRD